MSNTSIIIFYITFLLLSFSTSSFLSSSNTQDNSKGDSYSCNQIFSKYSTADLTSDDERDIRTIPIINFINLAKRAVSNRSSSSQTCTLLNVSFIKYGNNNFSNQSMCFSNISKTFFIILWKICARRGDVIEILTQNDLTYGGVLVVNGRVEVVRRDDISPSNVGFTYKYTVADNGIQTFELFGAEVCCGGGNVIKIGKNGETPKDYSIDRERLYCNALNIQMNNVSSTI